MKAPPGAVILVVAYGAGLLTGLSRFLDPVIALPTLLAAAWVMHRSRAATALITLAVGVCVGAAAREAARSRCTGALPLGERVLLVRTVDPGVSSGRARSSLAAG